MLQARARFVSADINLAAINTLEIAADLNDLRLALGYEKLNLWGISYSTKPAHAVMRDYPEVSSLPLTEFALGKHITDIAEKWGARTAGPAEHKAVKSDIPTLNLAGEFDQNTPSYWGKLAGETLKN